MLSGQAYAAEAQVEGIGAQPVAAFAETDLQALFEQDAKPMQLAALSEQEMRETEGALLPLFAAMAVGAAVSAWGYHARSYYQTGRIGTSAGAAWAAGAGALGALHGRGLVAYAGLRGISAAYVTARGMAVGAAWNAANPYWRR
jgi:hypothetical protein